MKLSRRRFLAISAASLCASGAQAAPYRWQGFALGAEVSLTLHAPEALALRASGLVEARLRRVEDEFSLYDVNSALSRLNAKGRLRRPAPMMQELLALCDTAHALTDGVFDPSVQSLWSALTRGTRIAPAQASVGWHRVTHDAQMITLGPGQALTFNGIAQGFATDLVKSDLQALGLTDLLVNIGEFAALGGPWRLGVSDPAHGLLTTRTLTDGAIATSSPAALSLGQNQTHILSPGRRPLWSTISVEAKTAAQADALSTAFCLMRTSEILATLEALNDGTRVTLIDAEGDLITLS
ncbi:FAD:protein FMN transferase [Thalassococcus sp. S3]|uniref:FAD:protein FMN transferase n=1 Tax=Thalassococcus sp. S3 TaxID=2017482 RepID=UPI0010247C3F|nr:FAD:protein FMN transferase [Thalassococcus sp. S3]QBF30620.1 nosX [Thalassococcus sp. S3]